MNLSRWWFETFVIFYPYVWGNDPIGREVVATLPVVRCCAMPTGQTGGDETGPKDASVAVSNKNMRSTIL